MIDTNARNRNAASSANQGFARRLARWAVPLALCAGLCGGVVSRSVRADAYTMPYTAGHAYVYYVSGNIPASTGTLQDAMAVHESDGHVYDLYGNQIVINADYSISDTNNQVVGFVYTASPIQPQIH